MVAVRSSFPQGWWEIDAMYSTLTLIIESSSVDGMATKTPPYLVKRLLKKDQDPEYLLLWHFSRKKGGICQKMQRM